MYRSSTGPGRQGKLKLRGAFLPVPLVWLQMQYDDCHAAVSEHEWSPSNSGTTGVSIIQRLQCISGLPATAGLVRAQDGHRCSTCTIERRRGTRRQWCGCSCSRAVAHEPARSGELGLYQDNSIAQRMTACLRQADALEWTLGPLCLDYPALGAVVLCRAPRQRTRYESLRGLILRRNMAEIQCRRSLSLSR
jgi:hypothetical protein